MVGVQAQKATQMKKTKEQNSAKDAFSCSVFSGVSNSFRFLVQVFSWFEAPGMAECQHFLAESDAATFLDTKKAGECSGRERHRAREEGCRSAQGEQCPDRNTGLFQR